MCSMHFGLKSHLYTQVHALYLAKLRSKTILLSLFASIANTTFVAYILALSCYNVGKSYYTS